MDKMTLRYSSVFSVPQNEPKICQVLGILSERRQNDWISPRIYVCCKACSNIFYICHIESNINIYIKNAPRLNVRLLYYEIEYFFRESQFWSLGTQHTQYYKGTTREASTALAQFQLRYHTLNNCPPPEKDAPLFNACH